MSPTGMGMLGRVMRPGQRGPIERDDYGEFLN